MATSKNALSTSLSPFLPENFRSWILVFTFPTAFILGIFGYYEYTPGHQDVYWPNALYHSAQLFLLHAAHFEHPVPWTLEVARWMAATSTGLILFNAGIHIFHHERMGLKLRWRKQHTIVCGLGRRGMAIVEIFHKNKIKIVAIDRDPEPEIVERLHRLGIPLIIGDAAKHEILKQAKAEQASQLYSICPDDTTNISIALAAYTVNKTAGSIIQCHVHINDAEVRNALQANHKEKQNEIDLKFNFIDAFETEAISLLAHGLPLDHDGIAPTDTRQVHLIILGFGCMGRTIAVKAAQLGQFANRKRLQISVIDRHADSNKAALLFHHPYIDDVADFSFHQQEVLSPATRILTEKWCNETNMLVNLVICLENTSIAYDVIFNLLPFFKRNNVRVAVRTNEAESFDFLMKGAGATKENGFNIKSFGLEKGFENLISPEKDEAEKFAIAIHKAYVDMIKEELKNDPTELGKKMKSGELNPWETLNEDFRESNRQQAVNMHFKIRACGYEITKNDDPRPAILTFDPVLFHALSIMEHNRWVAERKVNNWKYGDPSDKPNRINKNIVDWDLLTDEVKGYDEKTVAMIPELLRRVGEKMVEK